MKSEHKYIIIVEVEAKTAKEKKEMLERFEREMFEKYGDPEGRSQPMTAEHKEDMIEAFKKEHYNWYGSWI